MASMVQSEWNRDQQDDQRGDDGDHDVCVSAEA